MVAPGAGFRGDTLYRPKDIWRPRKSSLQNELIFSPKVCDDQKKKSLPTNQWVFGLKRKKKTQKVSSQNGDTRGGPPHPPSNATGQKPLISPGLYI